MGKRRKTPPRKIPPQREAPGPKAEKPIFSSPFKDLKKLLGERQPKSPLKAPAKGPAKSLAKGPFKTEAAERDTNPAEAAAPPMLAFDSAPVSYTHLTLPTICSV